ncbi:MAG: hypothetical protein H7831_09440 [Magnetococcus sp. WYHC-3]
MPANSCAPVAVLLLSLSLAVPGIAQDQATATSPALDARMFADDFERKDGADIGNGWRAKPNDTGCPGETSQPPTLYEGALFLHFQNSQGTQTVSREFTRQIQRLSYDFTPQYAMGGPDDRAWMGMQMEFLDEQGLAIGELRHVFRNHSVYAISTLSPTWYGLDQPGEFDGRTHSMVIDVSDLLKTHLTGVDSGRIATTRVSFHISAGHCTSTVEGSIDNVEVAGANRKLFHIGPESLKDLIAEALRLFESDRRHFPQNWIAHVRTKHSEEDVRLWVEEIRRVTQGDPGQLVDMAGNAVGSGTEASFAGAFALHILMDYYK